MYSFNVDTRGGGHAISMYYHRHQTKPSGLVAVSHLGRTVVRLKDPEPLFLPFGLILPTNKPDGMYAGDLMHEQQVSSPHYKGEPTYEGLPRLVDESTIAWRGMLQGAVPLDVETSLAEEHAEQRFRGFTASADEINALESIARHLREHTPAGSYRAGNYL